MTALVLLIVQTASASVLFAFLVVTLYNLCTAPRLSRPALGRDVAPNLPKVSLLVPVRDEAANLRECLPSWLGALRPGDDLLVLDDGSTDDSAAIARALGASVIAGRPLPPGWLGKSWACRQLAEHARGDVLVFVDADVSVHPRAVADAAAWFAGGDVDALSVMPRQIYSGWFDRAVVPFVMQYPLLCTLPLIQVWRSRRPALCAASGLWLAFTRDAYEKIGGHESVRDVTTEDVRLASLIKRAGLRLVMALAADRVSIAMYGSPRETRDGLGRSMFALCGHRWTTAFGVMIVHLLAFVVPWLAMISYPSWWTTALAGLQIVLVGVVAVTCGGGWWDVLAYPIGACVSPLVLIWSGLNHARGRVVWRGRVLDSGR